MIRGRGWAGSLWGSLPSGGGMSSLFTRVFIQKWTLDIFSEDTGKRAARQKWSSSEKLPTSHLATATRFPAIDIITNSSWASNIKGSTFCVQWKPSGCFWPGCFVDCCQKNQLDALCLVTGHCSYSDWKLFGKHERRGFLCVCVVVGLLLLCSNFLILSNLCNQTWVRVEFILEVI